MASHTFPMMDPRCQQGRRLRHVILQPLEIECFVCSECDALYLSEADIDSGKFQDLSTFLESKGIDSKSFEAWHEVLVDSK